MTDQNSRLSIEVDSRGAAREIGAVSSRLNRLSRSGERTSAQMSILTRSMGLAATAAAGYAGALSAGNVLSTASQLEQINSRLAASTNDVAGVQQFLARTANEAGQSYLTLADGFSKLLPLQKGGLLTMQQLEKVTLGLANASTVLGVETNDVNLALKGLTQIVSKGDARTTTEDFNQVFDNLGGVLLKVEKAAGIASGGLKQLVGSAEGISGRDILGKLVAGLESFDGQAQQLSGNIEQSVNRARTAYQLLVDDVSRPLNFVGAGSADLVADALTAIRDNAEEVGQALTVLGVIAAGTFGGAALNSLGRYSAGLLAATQQTTYFLNAERQAALASQANAAVRLESALASEAYAATKLRETQQQAASLTGLRRLTFATTELAAAERAATAATANRDTAANAATAATSRLDAANRSATVSARALAVAQRAGASALALVGGTAGLAVIAGAGLAYLALKQTDAEKSADALADAMDGLSSAFSGNATAAADSVRETINSQRANIFALEQQYKALLTLNDELRAGGGVSAKDLPNQTGQLKRLAEQIDSARENLEEFERSAQGFSISAAFDDEFQYVQNALRGVQDTADDASATIRESLSKLFPEDAKIAELEELRDGLRSIKDELSAGEYNRATQAINDQIASLKGVETASQRAANQARDLQAALEQALPDLQREEEYARQYKLLSDAFERGGENAYQYRNAMVALQAQFEKDSADATAAKYRELNLALSERTATPFAKYADEIELLNRAINELPDEAGNLAGNLQRAFSNLDFEIQAELTTVSGEDESSLKRDYAAKREALEQFIIERGRTEEQAEQDRITLAQSYGDQLVDVTQDTHRRLIELTSNSEPLLFDIQINAETIDLERILRDRGATEEEFRQAKQEQERQHQERLNNLVRDGEFTRAQFEQASYQARYAGLIKKYDAEINLAVTAATSILDSRVDRERRQADAAASVAQDDEQKYQQALAAFEKNGSEENKILLKNAKEKRDISKREAKKQFEDQKKASVQAAKLSAGVAIMNALATPPWYVGAGLALVAAKQGRDTIKGIKATKFSGGGSVSSGSGGSGSSSSSGSGNTPQTPAPPQVTERIIIVNGTFETEQQAIQRAAQANRAAVEQGLIRYENGEPNFQNVDQKTVFT